MIVLIAPGPANIGTPNGIKAQLSGLKGLEVLVVETLLLLFLNMSIALTIRRIPPTTLNVWIEIEKNWRTCSPKKVKKTIMQQ